MEHPKGASETDDVRLSFDRRVRLEFHGSKISSDGGLLLFRELDEVLDRATGQWQQAREGTPLGEYRFRYLPHGTKSPSAMFTL
jgi:hypothetical protein